VIEICGKRHDPIGALPVLVVSVQNSKHTVLLFTGYYLLLRVLACLKSITLTSVAFAHPVLDSLGQRQTLLTFTAPLHVPYTPQGASDWDYPRHDPPRPLLYHLRLATPSFPLVEHKQADTNHHTHLLRQ